MEKEVYKMIDRFLIKLEESENGIIIPFNRSLPKGKAAIQLMMEHKLADFGTDDIKAINIVQKNLNGRKILEVEGFEKWITANNLKIHTKEILELRKLELDVKNAERIYKTYWLTFGIAIGAFLIAIFSLWLQLQQQPKQSPATQQSPVKPSSEIK